MRPAIQSSPPAPSSAPPAAARPAAITVRDLTMAYGERVIQRDVSFAVAQGARFVIMGESGCGKSTLLKHMIGLLEPARGHVLIGDQDIWEIDADARRALARGFGVLYQSGALWTSMTVADNVALPLQQYTDFEPERIDELVRLKLALVGLGEAAERMPSELSGGMRKRAGLARAMALDPPILFLDEPSAGLDPISSRQLDELILEIGESLGTTFVMVSHELASIFSIATDSVFLDAQTHTQLDAGAPQWLVDHSPHDKVRRFLRRGDEPDATASPEAAASPASPGPLASPGARVTVQREPS